MIHFIGTSHAAVTLKEAARRRGLKITDNITDATLIFVSQDTPTDVVGNRDEQSIFLLLKDLPKKVPIVITSQVTPGFTAALQGNFYHQAETLRIEDAMQRAMFPEMFIVGAKSTSVPIHHEYMNYLKAFDCPIFYMHFEEAEFAKIAINTFLISQVETTNMLSKLAEKVGADWAKIAQVLRHDSRVGKFSYLTPGRWQASRHLLRDYRYLFKLDITQKLLKAWQ